MLVKYPELTVVGSIAIAVAISLGAAFFELMKHAGGVREVA